MTTIGGTASPTANLGLDLRVARHVRAEQLGVLEVDLRTETLGQTILHERGRRLPSLRRGATRRRWHPDDEHGAGHGPTSARSGRRRMGPRCGKAALLGPQSEHWQAVAAASVGVRMSATAERSDVRWSRSSE